MYFKSVSVWRLSFYQKLKIQEELFSKYIKQVSYFNEIIFGMPNMTTEKKNIEDLIKQTPYSIYSIQHRSLYRKTNVVFNESIDVYNIYCNFIVNAEIYPDTYVLSCISNNKIIKYGYAYISSYKQSCKLNKIFRDIKENDNLDTLEESDDEDEFEKCF